MVGDLSDSEGDLSSESLVKDEEFQGTEETHRAFSHGTELIPWYETRPLTLLTRTHTKLHASLTSRTLHPTGTCCRCNQTFTSSCCMGQRSSTTTRIVTSQLAACCDCSPTTSHSPGVKTKPAVSSHSQVVSTGNVAARLIQLTEALRSSQEISPLAS